MSCVHFPIWLWGSMCNPTMIHGSTIAQSHPTCMSSIRVPVWLCHRLTLPACLPPFIPAGAIVATKSESSVHSPAISILAGHCHPCPMLPLPPPHTTAHNTFVVQVSVSCCKHFRIFSTNLVYGGMALARSDVCGSAFEDMDRTKHRLSFHDWYICLCQGTGNCSFS